MTHHSGGSLLDLRLRREAANATCADNTNSAAANADNLIRKGCFIGARFLNQFSLPDLKEIGCGPSKQKSAARSRAFPRLRQTFFSFYRKRQLTIRMFKRTWAASEGTD